MINSTHARRQAGISLIEALVALAVMAVGMLGMVGMQATLRANSDVSKQRAEAVRIGQASIERWRAFPQLDAGGSGDFVDIVSGTVNGVPGSNASFTVTSMVPALAASAPKLKTVDVKVEWDDRAGQGHTVSLVTTIAGISPELAGTLGLPSNRAATQRPGGRSPAIPVAALDQGNGSSLFTPPNSGGITWTFNNTTGVITSVCVPATPCVANGHFLLSGFIRFATGDLPTGAEAEQPVDPLPLLPIGVEVAMTSPAASVETCFTENIGATAIAYYCALPTTTPPQRWSGRSRLTGLDIAVSLDDATATRYRVCRYTPEANHAPAGGNASHPLTYVDVTGALTRQNFLVISAGDGTVAYDCPGDGPLDFVNGTTYRHQPSA